MNILKHYLKWLLWTPLIVVGACLMIGIFVFALVGWILPLALGWSWWWALLIWWACAAAVVAVIAYGPVDDSYVGW